MLALINDLMATVHCSNQNKVYTYIANCRLLSSPVTVKMSADWIDVVARVSNCIGETLRLSHNPVAELYSLLQWLTAL